MPDVPPTSPPTAPKRPRAVTREPIPRAIQTRIAQGGRLVTFATKWAKDLDKVGFKASHLAAFKSDLAKLGATANSAAARRLVAPGLTQVENELLNAVVTGLTDLREAAKQERASDKALLKRFRVGVRLDGALGGILTNADLMLSAAKENEAWLTPAGVDAEALAALAANLEKLKAVNGAQGGVLGVASAAVVERNATVKSLRGTVARIKTAVRRVARKQPTAAVAKELAEALKPS